MRLALRVVYVTRCRRGPYAPISIPIIIGPPARPNFTGELIPGMLIGIAPMIRPSTIPMNIDAMLGSFSVFTVFPSTFSTFCIAAASPTTVSLSPS